MNSILLYSPSKKRLLIKIKFSSDEKLAVLFSTALVCTRQGQIERSMNISMACQSVLTKLPLYNHKKLPPLVPSQALDATTPTPANDKEYLNYFKPMFDVADYEFLYMVSVKVAEALEQSK